MSELSKELVKKIGNRVIELEIENEKENLFSKESMVNRIKKILEEEVNANTID
jgi:hypothetical protein